MRGDCLQLAAPVREVRSLDRSPVNAEASSLRVANLRVAAHDHALLFEKDFVNCETPVFLLFN